MKQYNQELCLSSIRFIMFHSHNELHKHFRSKISKRTVIFLRFNFPSSCFSDDDFHMFLTENTIGQKISPLLYIF